MNEPVGPLSQSLALEADLGLGGAAGEGGGDIGLALGAVGQQAGELTQSGSGLRSERAFGHAEPRVAGQQFDDADHRTDEHSDDGQADHARQVGRRVVPADEDKVDRVEQQPAHQPADDAAEEAVQQ